MLKISRQGFFLSAQRPVWMVAGAHATLLSVPLVGSQCGLHATLPEVLRATTKANTTCPVVQGSFDSQSNASSEPAEIGGSSGPVRDRTGNDQRLEGQAGQQAGPPDAPRHASWAKGMPPSGKKKKDSSGHKAALARLT